MNIQKLLDKAKKNGWIGIDESLSESLFGYGLLWIYRPKTKDYLFVIGTFYDDNREEFDQYVMEWFDEDAFDDFEHLISDKGFIHSIDIQDGEWDDKNIDDVPYMIYKIISYYGWQEVASSGGLEYSLDEIIAYISDEKWSK